MWVTGRLTDRQLFEEDTTCWETSNFRREIKFNLVVWWDLLPSNPSESCLIELVQQAIFLRQAKINWRTILHQFYYFTILHLLYTKFTISHQIYTSCYILHQFFWAGKPRLIGAQFYTKAFWIVSKWLSLLFHCLLLCGVKQNFELIASKHCSAAKSRWLN